MRSLLLVVFIAFNAHAQSVRLPVAFEALRSKASNVVEVSLDGPMLKAATASLDSKKVTEKAAGRIARKLKGIYVHQYSFDDVDVAVEQRTLIAAQLHAPEWSKIVTTRRKNENETADVYARQTGESVSGLVVVSTRQGEITVVDLVGDLQPEDINSLSGTFGIPSVEVAVRAGRDAGQAP